MRRWNISSGAPWEDRVGYSRAVRAGVHVFVSGTAAVGHDGGIVGEGDAHAQTIRAFEIVEQALAQAGASLEDVVRTRMFVIDMADSEKIGQAHARFFGDTRPATTLVEVHRLIDSRMLVEVEAEAIVGSARERDGAAETDG